MNLLQTKFLLAKEQICNVIDCNELTYPEFLEYNKLQEKLYKEIEAQRSQNKTRTLTR